MSTTAFTEADIRTALSTVDDPELNRPITELGMVKSISIQGSTVLVEVYLTIAGCPMKNTITSSVHEAVSGIEGVERVTVTTDVMNDEQRAELRKTVRGGNGEPIIPFAQASSTTRVYAIASGKGGVGKSSVTVNLGVSLASRGLKVGIIDADIYGHSIPQMMGSHNKPHQVDEMIIPPQVHGVKVMSIGHFLDDNAPIVWRGPMLHRALQQFLSDVFWGDLDILLLDLPPGTGDIALSVAQLIPNAELVIVTTPQSAAAGVAERAGAIAKQTHQKITGVIENMSWLDMPDGTRMDVFGSGGGQIVAQRLSEIMGTDIPLLGQIPLDPQLRIGGDLGNPIAISEPDSTAAQAFKKVSETLSIRSSSLAGRSLNLGVGKPSAK